jgi:hypothetical protein
MKRKVRDMKKGDQVFVRGRCVGQLNQSVKLMDGGLFAFLFFDYSPFLAFSSDQELEVQR